MGDGTLEERRRDVIAKLTAAVQTSTDFVALAALFGIDAEVVSGTSEAIFPFTFPILFMGSTTEAKFTIITKTSQTLTDSFPFTFPFTFENADLAKLECFFNKLKPSNTQVIFKQV